MKLYVSEDPEAFNLAESAPYTKIDNGVVKFITNDNFVRKYFMLSFDNQYFKIIGSRFMPAIGIQNFRDIGGYSNKNQQEIRWGKVYRSGDLTQINHYDSIRLAHLKIKTILDLRPTRLVQQNPIQLDVSQIINISISTVKGNDVNTKLRNGKMKKGDGKVFLEDTYLRFVNECNNEFGKAIRMFANIDNYPILISSGLGKDKIGYLTAILMSILEIPKESIRKEYMLSNNHININQFNYARKFNTDAQETITLLLTAHESCINIAFKEINKRYGSVDKYLKEGLKVTEEEICKIREILLR